MVERREPQRTETTTEIREITVGVKPYQRDFFFHREPYMDTTRYGYITVEWDHPWRLPSQALIKYYEKDTYKGYTHPLDIERVLDEWKKGATPNPEFIKPKGNVFVQRWSCVCAPDGNGELLTLASKDKDGLALLKIKVASP